MIGPHKVHLERERANKPQPRKGHKVMRLNELEQQMQSLVNAVQSLTPDSSTVLAESSQQCHNISPRPPTGSVGSQVPLKRCLSKDNLVKKKKKRKGRKSKPNLSEQILRVENRISEKIDLDYEAALQNLATKQKERISLERQYHEKRFAELCKNLNLKVTDFPT